MEFMKQYKILLKKAKVDLRVVKNLYEDFSHGDEELDLEVIMFHAQQSSEKLLKTLLSYAEVHVTKTHDIKTLITLIRENQIEILDEIECLIPLTYYAVEGRYSILHDDIEDAEKYIRYLEKLLIFVTQKVENEN